MSTAALLVMVVVSAGFVLWPLLARRSMTLVTSPDDTPLGRLELRKEILLENILDLDFEHSMGKLADSDHAAMRESLERQAALVIEQISVLNSEQVTTATLDSDVPEAKARYCTECGEPVPPRAKFCPGCGEKVVS